MFVLCLFISFLRVDFPLFICFLVNSGHSYLFCPSGGCFWELLGFMIDLTSGAEVLVYF